MSLGLRAVDWTGVWNSCQEEKHHRRERRPERVDGKAAQQMPTEAESKGKEGEEGTVPNSYHQLTPKKRTPQLRDGEPRKHERKTVPSRHQAKPESNHEDQVLQKADDTQDYGRRSSSSRATNCKKTSATNWDKSAAEAGWVKLEDRRVDVMNTSNGGRGRDGEVDRETVTKLSSKADAKAFQAGQSTDADAGKDKENGGRDALEEIKAISRQYDDGVKERVRTEEREETSYSQREMRAETEEGKTYKNIIETYSDDEPTTAESTLTLTANEDDDGSETETVDKCTQVTYCALHKTFLALRTRENHTQGATVENEGKGKDRIVKAEDDGYGEEVKEEEDVVETREGTKSAQSLSPQKRRLKRRMALLAASIGNSILGNKRRHARKTPTVVEETKG